MSNLSQSLSKAQKALDGLTVYRNEPLSKHTYFRLGGPADLFIPVKRREELERIMFVAKTFGLPWFLFGGGSNVIIGDLGIRGIVIKNEMTSIHHDGVFLTAESGALLHQVVLYANTHGLGGLENYVSIPGTIGGAIYNNAHGWPDREQLIGNLLDYATVFNQGFRKTVDRDWFRFSYEYSHLQEVSEILLSVTFSLRSENPEKLQNTSRSIAALRHDLQPIGQACSGCVFANPPKDTAGRLIEAAGLKGERIGHALVSPIHANFVVNEGGATVKDVLELMARVQRTVENKLSVHLQPEVFFVGEFSWIPEGFKKT